MRLHGGRQESKQARKHRAKANQRNVRAEREGARWRAKYKRKYGRAFDVYFQPLDCDGKRGKPQIMGLISDIEFTPADPHQQFYSEGPTGVTKRMTFPEFSLMSETVQKELDVKDKVTRHFFSEEEFARLFHALDLPGFYPEGGSPREHLAEFPPTDLEEDPE